MSRRNSREAKARRRAERETRHRDVGMSVDVTSFDELVDLAHAGAKLPCGCDAHQALHEVLQIEDGQVPPGWHELDGDQHHD